MQVRLIYFFDGNHVPDAQAHHSPSVIPPPLLALLVVSWIHEHPVARAFDILNVAQRLPFEWREIRIDTLFERALKHPRENPLQQRRATACSDTTKNTFESYSGAA